MKNRNGIHPAGNIAMDSAPDIQAQLLSVRVEGELGKPAVVMVTSACAGDGISLAAYSLAIALEIKTHRVSLMEIPHEERTPHERLAAFVEKMRSNYDFTIIDAGTFENSSTVLSLARLVDGILISVRIGRAPVVDEESIVGMFEQCGGNVIGVVAIEAEAIASFERAQQESSALTRVHPRRSTEQNSTQALMAVSAERVLR